MQGPEILLKKTNRLKCENIFLILSVVFGLAYTLFQPIFIEPDSSYHFEHVTYISNTVVDRGSLGFNGEDYQQNFDYFSSENRNGTYFQKFFKTKLPVVNKEKVQDKRVIGSTWLNDIKHVIPAVGVKISRVIYPSIAIMVIGGRLFNLIFFILSLYFIIKYLKGYQLLFTVISVSPTVIQFATSLSYDCYNYVAFAYMAATLINIAVDMENQHHPSFLQLVYRLSLPSIVLYFSKSNSKILYLMVAMFFVYWFFERLKIEFSKKKKLMIGISVFFIAVLGFLVTYHNQLGLITRKFFYTILEPNYTILSTEILSGASGSVPLWFYPIEVMGVIFLLLSVKKESVPRWFALSCLLIVIINLVGVSFQYSIMPAFGEKVITGSQGRYFTSFILLLGPIFSVISIKNFLSVTGKYLKPIIILISIVSLVLNLSIISLKFYHLKVPSGRYRSDSESMILK